MIQINTSVKIIVAPVGIPAKYEIAYPAEVPMNPAATDNITIFKYVFVNIIAMLGGIVRSEITSTTPAILILSTIVSAISEVVIYLKTLTYEEYVLAKGSSNEI
jgi:hypothetical protein